MQNAARKKHYYIVSGRGQFPDDMLRYDQAEIIGPGQLLGRPAYLIYGLCTVGRWQSFLWTVFGACKYFPAGDSEKGPVQWKAHVQGKWDLVDIKPFVAA